MAGLISKEVIEQIRQASDIVDVIGDYVPLKKAGSKFKALSPFNKEKTPSFFVDPSKQIFKCFSSGNGGDVFKFVTLYENLDFPAAVRRLAQRAGIPIPETAFSEGAEEQSQRELLFELHNNVALWWKNLLRRDPIGEPAREYLKSRRIHSELAAEFGLGYAPPSWDGTLNWAKEKGYSTSLLDLAGLVTTNESGKPYDRFRGRLMFPICNESGQIVAFSGRLLDPDAKAAKYVNSPDTPLFSKSRILFGLDKTKRAIIDARSAIICEGQIDLIRCFTNGIKNVAAPQGTAFTEEQGRLLKRYAEEVVLCFDADGAGKRAAERSVEVLLECGLNVRIAEMPAGEDPDSLLLKERKEEFIKIIEAAPDYTRYLLESSCKENDITSPRGRSLVAEKMAPIVKKIASPVQKQAVAHQVAHRLQIPLSIFLQEMEKVKAKPIANSSEKENVKSDATAALDVSPVLTQLLSILFSHPEMVPIIQRELDPFWLEGLAGHEILLRLLDTHAHDAWEDEQHFLDESNDAERNFLSGLLLHPLELEKSVSIENFASDLIGSIHKKWMLKRMTLLEQELKSNLLSPEEVLAKSKELLDIKRGCF